MQRYAFFLKYLFVHKKKIGYGLLCLYPIFYIRGDDENVI